MSLTAKALIIVTSHAELGATGRKTGFYFDEMATPYWALMDAGYDVVIASPKGGAAPWDLSSYGTDGNRPSAVQRFIDDAASMAKIANTSKVADLNPKDFAAVFLPGGHGTMWDFTNPAIALLVGKAWDHGAVVGAVCHGPAGLVHAVKANGGPLVDGLKVNSFTDAEEAAINLTDVVPFLLESELRKRGARFEGSANFTEHAVRDGRLVTGQNPRSVAKVARLLIEALTEERRLTA